MSERVMRRSKAMKFLQYIPGIVFCLLVLMLCVNSLPVFCLPFFPSARELYIMYRLACFYNYWLQKEVKRKMINPVLASNSSVNFLSFAFDSLWQDKSSDLTYYVCSQYPSSMYSYYYVRCFTISILFFSSSGKFPEIWQRHRYRELDYPL